MDVGVKRIMTRIPKVSKDVQQKKMGTFGGKTTFRDSHANSFRFAWALA
jgi:hypothetical protein